MKTFFFCLFLVCNSFAHAESGLGLGGGFGGVDYTKLTPSQMEAMQLQRASEQERAQSRQMLQAQTQMTIKWTDCTAKLRSLVDSAPEATRPNYAIGDNLVSVIKDGKVTVYSGTGFTVVNGFACEHRRTGSNPLALSVQSGFGLGLKAIFDGVTKDSGNHFSEPKRSSAAEACREFIGDDWYFTRGNGVFQPRGDGAKQTVQPSVK